LDLVSLATIFGGETPPQDDRSCVDAPSFLVTPNHLQKGVWLVSIVESLICLRRRQPQLTIELVAVSLFENGLEGEVEGRIPHGLHPVIKR
jgi:hypothetical protein